MRCDGAAPRSSLLFGEELLELIKPLLEPIEPYRHCGDLRGLGGQEDADACGMNLFENNDSSRLTLSADEEWNPRPLLRLVCLSDLAGSILLAQQTLRQVDCSCGLLESWRVLNWVGAKTQVRSSFGKTVSSHARYDRHPAWLDE